MADASEVMASRSYKAPMSGVRVRPGQTGASAEAAIAEITVIEGMASLNDQPVDLESYQRAFMLRTERFRCVEKARQTGFSWIFAAEAVARCHLRDTHRATFISYNLGDAVEKIRYARAITESLPAGFRKKIVEDAKTHLAFEDGQGRRTLIQSHPSKAPRGKGGDVYLDELAHYQDDTEVYKGTTALIARHPRAQLTVCSTPAGRQGVFWEIARQETEKRYPGFVRMRVPWWLSRHYCRDPQGAVRAGIANMPADQAVEEWGTTPIQEQRQSLLLDDFLQEFATTFIDEKYSYFPWKDLLAVARDLKLEEAFQGWSVRGRLTAGYDVGRRRDMSALCICEEVDDHVFPRYLRWWHNQPFAAQHATLIDMMEALPIARLSIDEQGIGMQLAEQMAERFGSRVQKATFTLQNKETWATDLKILIEGHKISLPRDRDLLTQTHSIRRVVIAGKPRFDSESNAGHHGDLFWALALAAQRERQVVTPRVHIRARVI